MASYRRDKAEGGYATPFALMLSVSMALVCSAVLTKSVQTLRLSRADLDRSRQEIGLDGAHLAAAAAIVRNGEQGPYRWEVTTDIGFAEVLAEPEIDKLSLATAAASGAVLAAFEVTDVDQLRARLIAAGDLPHMPQIGALDDSPLWRRCADSAVSADGARSHLRPPAYNSPNDVAAQPAWRIGETWRVRVTTSAGWRDDRIVRFTGDPQHPAAIVRRNFSRTHEGWGQCDELLAAIAGA